MRGMDSLFSEVEDRTRFENAPLAVRMRPDSLDDLVGQDDVCGKGTWLRNAIETDELSSIIFFGPAGTGKTSLAHIIASATKAVFVEVSAVTGTVSDLRREIDAAEKRLAYSSQRTILFVDEIHRFSRSQQDSLLHAVEDRVVVLIGATTENPYFEVNTALLSRSRVIELKPLTDEDIRKVVMRALADERGLHRGFAMTDQALDAIVMMSGGDARAALTTLEMSQSMAVAASDLDDEAIIDDGVTDARPVIARRSVEEAAPSKTLPYDKKGDAHYDIVSAFIKSMRGSDPDAAVYWLARMIEGGEDPKFIARRIFILASEDIGNADPQALLVAEAAFKATEVIGYPECGINLAQAVVYMALAPKSNASYMALAAASDEVRKGPLRAVPDHLRDRHRPGSENYGPYLYPHSYPGGWVEQRYLPEGLQRGCFYHPGERGWEAYRTEAVASDRHPHVHDAGRGVQGTGATEQDTGGDAGVVGGGQQGTPADAGAHKGRRGNATERKR